jgi:opacity protein-like surface antigen
MKMLTVALSLVAAGSFASAAAAQERPDFSGEWTIAAEPSPAAGQPGGGQGFRPGEFGSGWGRTITIAQDAGALKVVWPFYVRGDLQPPLTFVYALDGSATTDTVLMGRGMQEQVSRAAWEGNRLVITTVHAFAHPQNGQRMTTEVKRTLSLAAPTSLVVETAIGGVLGGPPTTSRAVYTRG